MVSNVKQSCFQVCAGGYREFFLALGEYSASQSKQCGDIWLYLGGMWNLDEKKLSEIQTVIFSFTHDLFVRFNLANKC